MRPGTIRKERAMILAFYTWAWREGLVSADSLLSIRAVPLPVRATGLARPKPYKRWEIQGLWRRLDERWPRLPAADVARWLRRWEEGRTPYARVRTHAVHAQLEAMITLALSCGLRRGEIYAGLVDDFHPDNGYIVARRADGSVREVPHTTMAREAIAAWLDVRARVNPSHDCLWLNLWSRKSVTHAMTAASFEKVLITYVGPGWTFRRLRDTCAVEWLRAGLPVWHLQQLLGHKSLKDTLPYLEANGSDVAAHASSSEGRLALRPATTT